MTEPKKKKKKIRMPHLLVLMLGLLAFISILTYIIPAGEFGVDPVTGERISTEFHYLGAQTPINFWEALLMIPDGLTNSGNVLAMLFTMGGLTGIIMETKAIDKMMDYTIYRLKDKGIDVLVPTITLIFLIFGAFAGGDYMVAMVPIGLMIAKKLRTDPMVGFGMVMIAGLYGMISSPTNVLVPQVMMGVPAYSGFGMRMILMMPVFVITILYIWRYARKVEKNPEKSVLGKGEWYGQLDTGEEPALKEVKMEVPALAAAILYFAEPVVVLMVSTYQGLGMEAVTAVTLIFVFLIGIMCGMSQEEIGRAFAKGLSSMAFIGFVIGISYTMSLVMEEGNIMPTIIYSLCLPLQNLSFGVVAIGIFLIIAMMDILITSSSAKAAILCPIIRPMCESLGVPLQIGVSAFKYGDTVTNMLSPLSGSWMGGLELAKIPFNRFLKWALPLSVIIIVYCIGTLYFMGVIGWTGV